MGIELIGLDPRSRAGECFAASFWEWRPAVALVREAAPDLIDEAKAIDLSYNDSSGIGCDASCRTIAESISEYLQKHSGRVLLAGDSVNRDGLGELLITCEAGLEEKSYCYELTPEVLSDLRSFLLACGGFSVC